MTNYICVTCGTQYPTSAQPPAHCPICEEDRQYIGRDGQRWTTLAELRKDHRNDFAEAAPGVTGIVTIPQVAIGQQANLIQTPHGNLLWDCISFIDNATIEAVRTLGGIAAIAISHPHFFSSMIEWAGAFDAPIHLHADHRPWVMRPEPAVRFWEGETRELLPGLTAIRCGGHFPGSTVLHWRDGANGKGALFTGDTMQVVSDRRWVSFMYSYPNLIPLDPATIRRIISAVEPFPFDRLHGMNRDQIIAPDAKAAVHRSADRYIAHITG